MSNLAIGITIIGLVLVGVGILLFEKSRSKVYAVRTNTHYVRESDNVLVYARYGHFNQYIFTGKVLTEVEIEKELRR